MFIYVTFLTQTYIPVYNCYFMSDFIYLNKPCDGTIDGSFKVMVIHRKLNQVAE